MARNPSGSAARPRSKRAPKPIGHAFVALTTANPDDALAVEFQHTMRWLASQSDRITIAIDARLNLGHAREPGAFLDFVEEIGGTLLHLTGARNRLAFYAALREQAFADGAGATGGVSDTANPPGDVVFCDHSLLGPLRAGDDFLHERAQSGLDGVSAFSHHSDIGPQFAHLRDTIRVIADTTWLQVSPELFGSDDLGTALAAGAKAAARLPAVDADAAFSSALERADRRISGLDISSTTTSQSPYLLEAAALVRQGHPFVHMDSLLLDPMIYEMQALRGAELVRLIDASDYPIDTFWKAVLAKSSLRDVATRFVDLHTVGARQPTARKRKRPAHKLRCALVAHVYYTDFIHEVIAHFRKFPAGSDLLVSVASAEGQRTVEDVLENEGIQATVRPVAQNRGRDMSSLFITFRHEFAGNDYDLALRLHSKKTPQMPAHISDTFRDHLVENLVRDEATVDDVVALFERDATIGMAVPPTIHVAFGTLGHAWFANREGTAKVAARLGVAVPMDPHTPLAAYGTMFWFRPKALRPMFAEAWGWEEFNAEPNHVDGGLAHIMERLMSYVVQSQGFRVSQVATPEQLARSHVRLEYKLQRLASSFPSGDVREQVRLADLAFGGGGSGERLGDKVWNRWVGVRTRIKREHPAVWATMLPALKVARRTFVEKPRKLQVALRIRKGGG